MDTTTNNSQPLQSKSGSKLIWVLLVILIIVIAASAIWYFKFYNQPNQTATATITPATNNTSTITTTAIKNDTDLQSASSDLDSANPDTIDTTLSQNSADAAQF